MACGETENAWDKNGVLILKMEKIHVDQMMFVWEIMTQHTKVNHWKLTFIHPLLKS